MPTATTGLIMRLQDALKQLTDAKGNPLEFTEQKDGTWKAPDVEGDNYTYQYTLNPEPTTVTVSETKTSKEDNNNSKKGSAATTTTASAKKSEEKPSSTNTSSRRNPV